MFLLMNSGQLSKIKIVISSLKSTCYFPFGNEAVGLYSKQSNSLYADLFLIPNFLKIEYQINFWSFNLEPNSHIKLLQINNASGDSKSLSINLYLQSMQFYPNTIQDIVDFITTINNYIFDQHK